MVLNFWLDRSEKDIVKQKGGTGGQSDICGMISARRKTTKEIRRLSEQHTVLRVSEERETLPERNSHTTKEGGIGRRRLKNKGDCSKKRS